MSTAHRTLILAVLVAAGLLVVRSANAASPAPVIIYHEAQADGSLILYRKVGNTAPEALATLEDVPHAPAYRLSYSKKLLALNLGSSIQIIDLVTKQVKTLLRTDGTFDSLTPPTAGVAITTNDKYLLAIERTLGPNEEPPGGERNPDEVAASVRQSTTGAPTRYTYRIHYVNIKTGKDKVLRRATVRDVNVPRFFRTDGLALLLTPSGQLTLFDVEKKKFIRPVNTLNTRLFSGDGVAMPVEGERQTTACGKPREYSIVDYRTGKSFGFVKTENNYVRMIAIAPKKDAVLFSSTAVADDTGKCTYGAARYFVANLLTGEVTETSDYLAVMREYDAWYVGAREGTKMTGAQMQYAIYINGVSVVASAKRLTIAAQYWLQSTPSGEGVAATGSLNR